MGFRGRVLRLRRDIRKERNGAPMSDNQQNVSTYGCLSLLAGLAIVAGFVFSVFYICSKLAVTQ